MRRELGRTLISSSGQSRREATRSPRSGRFAARRDLVALGTVTAAIVLFVPSGAAVLPHVFAALAGTGIGPDRVAASALLLNITLIIVGWRRYRDLTGEVAVRRDAEQQARSLAGIDPLTGCLNRRSIGAATAELLDSLSLRRQAAAYVMIDLDNFKQVNDVHGHAAGDALLIASAQRIRAILPAGALLARIGGDEFACVVAFDPSRTEVIDRLVESLIIAVAAPITFNDLVLETTISAGIAQTNGGSAGSDPQILLHLADIAMYFAKKRGRNRHFWFEPSMETDLRFRSELETGIRRGVLRREFVPYYEKQVDLATGQLLGFEMLARWHSPTMGIVGPDIFIPIAEEIGAIAELSEQIIARALLDARDWNPRLTLSVNISPVQLRDPWFAQKILKMLVEANFPPSRLDIEITENCLYENIGIVETLIASLKNQGVQISLDDFGAGYNSLSRLRSLPFDRIKIDRSFITTLPGNPNSATIVRSISALGEGLGLPITVEGIENQDILDEVRQLGNFKAQGYFYGKPATAQATRDELAKLNLLQEPEPQPAMLDIEAADAAAKVTSTRRI